MLAVAVAAGLLSGIAQVPALDSLVVPGWADTTTEVEVVIFPPPTQLPVSYQVAWGDGETLDWSGALTAATDVSRYHKYGTSGTFGVRVRYRNSAGTMSDWSGPRDVLVGDRIWKWTFPTADPVVGAPSLDAGGNIYFGDESGTLYSLTTQGSLRWTAKARDAVYGTPVIAGNRVYFGSLDSTLYCVDTAGRPVWTLRLGDALYSPPAVGADGTLYIGTDLGTLASVSNKGKLRWTRKLGDEIAAPATVGANGLIYQSADSVYCFDSKGRRRWAFGAPEGEYFFAAAVPDPGGLVYVGNNDGYLYCIGPDGRLRWRAPAPDEDEIRSEVTVGLDGSLFFGSDGDYCIRMAPGGTPTTFFETNDIIIASAAISDRGTTYYLSDDGTLRAFTADHRILYARDVVSGDKDVYYTGSPTIGPDGTVYVTSWDGGISAFRGDGPPANTWWPQYRHDAQHTGRVQPPTGR